MKIYNLSSGSKGNSTLVVCDEYKILIDVGTTKTYLKSALAKLGYHLNDIDLVLLTHYHSDHVKALNSFDDNIIMSDSNYKYHCTLDILIDNPLNEHVYIKPFILSHDDLCYGYQIKFKEEILTYITDTGYVKIDYLPLIQEADYLYLEFNHDIVKLHHTGRPPYLKERILSDSGHLNNHDASLILYKGHSEKLKQLFVAHISQEANTVELIEHEIQSIFKAYNQEISFDILYTKDHEITAGGCLNED